MDSKTLRNETFNTHSKMGVGVNFIYIYIVYAYYEMMQMYFPDYFSVGLYHFQKCLSFNKTVF